MDDIDLSHLTYYKFYDSIPIQEFPKVNTSLTIGNKPGDIEFTFYKSTKYSIMQRLFFWIIGWKVEYF